MKKSIFYLISLLLASCSSNMQEISLDAKAFTSGWGIAKADSSISGTPLSIAGKAFTKGIGTHSYSEAVFRLDGKKGRFKAMVGIDDNCKGEASVVFYVLTNKGIAFNSGLMRDGDAAKPVEIDLKGVTDLCLIVDPVDGNNSHDHADWAEARFIVQTPPFVATHEREEAYILTPPPAPEPRINGAKITGASAGKPFLFTIATTGNRPMKFAAEGLPEGLTLDTERGLITGKAVKNGKYIVPVTATNDKGTCADTLEIVIGGGLALTPHMGWNSWYFHQLRITQDIMERSAKAMYDYGMINYGYTYVNIDDGWEIRVDSDDPVVGGKVRNPDGTIRTNKNFPNMKKMTDYIHRLGLKAGLYSSPGVATCGGYAGSLGHEAQDVKSYCDWGFDFLKYDWCSYGREVKSPVSLEDYKKPYILIDSILKNASRDIVLNLCQYGMGDVWKWGKEVGGHSWRTGGDLGGSTDALINEMFRAGFFQESIRQYSGPDGWNDPDYLLFGKIWHWRLGHEVPSPFSPNEQYSCMTLWCMMSAPLIFSGELVTLDEFTLNVLCNAEVIDINQDKLGKPGYSIFKEDFLEIWKKELYDGSTALAVFNKSPLKTTVTIDWKKLGYEEGYIMRDLWRQSDLGRTGNFAQIEMPRHGCYLFKMRK
ncbi:MAG: NPCBM/NEW2 domain-containing protein [Tannerella sp.]|nr:NPCBM/NEW2 domain-containing protein [Tannerella sp.]